MAPSAQSVLVVEDDADFAALVTRELGRRGYAAFTAHGAGEALALLSAQEIAVVVTDIQMPGISGLELTERIKAAHGDVPIILMTAFGSLEKAIAAMRAGAHDFLSKPFELDELVLRVERAVEHRNLRRELVRLRKDAGSSAVFPELVGQSPSMRELFLLLDQVAPSDASVLITGETGTGKEVVARAIHRRSRRADAPFVGISCAAMPENLLESELFGHVRGAFTDARAARKGLFLQAQGGTLFLDEIGEMPVGLQAKLLRTLQERTLRPVGGDQEVSFDVRLLSATNRDIESAIAAGSFREDLFYRLNVVEVRLPPLRSRGSDVLVLAHHFLKHFALSSGKPVDGIAPECAERLVDYPWPGNVRELSNAIERAVALTQYQQLTAADLPEKIRTFKRSHVIVASQDPEELVSMEEVERRYVLRVMEAVHGNKTHAARILGFDRKTLYAKLKAYGHGD
jgi:two-component system, NtrC family, response regulator AtoC